MAENTIRIVKVEPNARPQQLDIPNTLDAGQQIVDGYVEGWTLRETSRQFGRPIQLFCNEDGRRLNLPPNRWLDELRTVVFGTFFLAAVEDSDWASLSDSEIEFLKDKFAQGIHI